MSEPRVALVTGAAGGIGSATVARLLDQGYAVIGVDREAAVVPESERAVHLRGDVRDQEVLDSAVALATERWGRLDAVVAAAAVIAGGRPLWETPAAEVYDLWEADARTVWQTAVAAVPAMLGGPDPAGCRFVAVASSAAHQGLFGLGAYVAAKHAVVGFVKGLAADLVGTGVTACAVSPGSTRTPMLDATAEIYGLSDAEAFTDRQLLRRLLEPTEIAATLAFCCSREAAVLNGSVVHADGGYS